MDCSKFNLFGETINLKDETARTGVNTNNSAIAALAEKVTANSEAIKAKIATPEDFGAVGDGVTDDSTALQSFMTYCVENKAIGLMKNNYATSKQLEIDNASGLVIIGINAQVTAKNPDGTWNVFRFNNCDTITISGVNVNLAQQYGESGGHAYYMVDCNNMTIENCTITGVYYGCIMAYPVETTSYLKNINIKNVKMVGAGKNSDNIHPTGIIIANGSDCSIENCYAENLYYYTFEFKNYSFQCRIDKCTAYQCFRGFYLGGDADGGSPASGFYTQRCSITNCVAVNCSSPLTAGKSRYLTISNFTSRVTTLLWGSQQGVRLDNCEHVMAVGLDIDGNSNTYTILDVRSTTQAYFSGVVTRLGSIDKPISYSSCSYCACDLVFNAQPANLAVTGNNTATISWKGSKYTYSGGASASIYNYTNPDGDRHNFVFASGQGYLASDGWHSA